VLRGEYSMFNEIRKRYKGCVFCKFGDRWKALLKQWMEAFPEEVR